ncbi:MAG: ECF-type sigma factor [Bryobacterales bacterium]|jgi:RNA polymerase sigma factor (TIGR02999 family)|nr:ECF-type sigma factor [Bryobacterales bacterium]
MDKPGEITQLLQDWRQGDPEAFARLMPVAYDQLHRIALGLMRRERGDHTLQPTALLNELYLRLVNQQRIRWEDRQHFFTFAARLMRNILVDHARTRSAQRRGGKERDLPLTLDLPWLGTEPERTIDLMRALDRLEALDARKARIVEYRILLSFTIAETASLLEISAASVERDLRFARGWLYRELHPPAESATLAMADAGQPARDEASDADGLPT